MKTFKVSDEVFEQLKSFVVDPFDDTPDVVLRRLIDIVRKARNTWSPFDVSKGSREVEPSVKMSRLEPMESREEEPVVVL